VVPLGLPAALRELIEECLQLDPERRPVPAAVAARLRRLDRSPGPVYGPPTLPPMPPAPPPAPPAPPPMLPPAPPPAPPPTSHTRARPARARPLAAGTRTRVVLLAAAALAIVGLTVVVLQSLPSATSEQRPAAGTAPPAAGTLGPIAPPQLAADARAPTQAGAAAFVKYWFATLSYAAASGDTAPFQTASAPGCQACADAVQAIRSGWQNGRQMRGGSYTIRNVSADGFFTVEHPALTTVFDRSPRSTLAGTGTELETLPGVMFATCRVLLERAGADWRVLSAQSDRPVA
jgi:hypothetical protein